MTPDQAALRRAYDEIFNHGDFVNAGEAVADDVVLHAPLQLEPLQGLERLEALVGELRAAFPNLHATVEDMFEEDHTIFLRSTIRGTQKGECFGIPPTGGNMSVTKIAILRLERAKVREIWLQLNVADVLAQLGMMPPLDGMPRPIVALLARRQRRRMAKGRRSG